MNPPLTEPIPPDRAARLRLRQFLPVLDRSAGNTLGRLVDLSVTGMMLIATRELPVGQHFELEIRMPEGLALPPLRIDAESVWCRPSPSNARHFGVGFRFVTVPPDVLAQLQALMQEDGILH